MLVKTLTVMGARRNELLRIDWYNGRAWIDHVSPDLQDAADEWVHVGLAEWVGRGDGVRHRVTKPESPEFLERLATYIEQRSAALSTHLRERPLVSACSIEASSVTPRADRVIHGTGSIFFFALQQCSMPIRGSKTEIVSADTVHSYEHAVHA